MKTIEKTYTFKASKEAVWKALTDPVTIKKYFFGTDATGEWKEGGEIIYTGEYNGTVYEDKGRITKYVPGETLTMQHWSSMSGTEDKPENYSMYSYQLKSKGEQTDLKLVQENKSNNPEGNPEAWKHWDMAMESLKKVLEG